MNGWKKNSWVAISWPVDLLTKWEWFRDKAYKDSAWKWTVWFWFTNLNWKPVKEWDTITLANAKEKLNNEIDNRQNYKGLLSVKLTPQQEAALTSFEYNLWSNIWKWSAKPIIDKINAWDINWAAEYMKLFNKAWGKVIKWLQNRRKEESNLLLT